MTIELLVKKFSDLQCVFDSEMNSDQCAHISTLDSEIQIVVTDRRE